MAKLDNNSELQKKAVAWWKTKTLTERKTLCVKHKNIVFVNRKPETLKPLEITKVYKKEFNIK